MFLLEHTTVLRYALQENQTCMCPTHTSGYTKLYSLKGTAFYCIGCFSRVCVETARRELGYVFQNALFKFLDKPKYKMCLSCSTVVFMKQSSPCPKCGFTRWANVEETPHARPH